MKLLLDECLPVDFRHSFPNHETHTVEWSGLKGQKNGALRASAVAVGYDVFLTVDRGLPQQRHPIDAHG
jgi:predicted nuclease of predicted toxin-antitoxin system